MKRLFLSTLLGALLAGPLAAATECASQPHPLDEEKLTLGPNHHPMGRPLPATENFHQPNRCVGNIWFFDENANARPDAGEIRVFGSNRQVDCGSCHGESPDGKSPTSAGVFLRQDAQHLCLVCHNL